MEESTNRSYDSVWKAWCDHAFRAGKDPCARDDLALVDFVAARIKVDKAKEGTCEKTSTVVSSTWDVIESPETQLAKLKMSASKVNGAKSKGLASVWNLWYLHEYFYAEDLPSDLKEATMVTIAKLRGATGWRSADVKGLYLDLSFTVVPKGSAQQPGIFIRAYDMKTNKRGWSNRTFIPFLADEFKSLCAAQQLLSLRKVVMAGNAGGQNSLPAS